MTRKNLIACVVVALMFGAMGAYVGQRRPPPAPLAASAAPAVTAPVQALFGQTLPDAGGTPQALSQWKGKALLVNFWAPWCAPCVQEMPELSALQAKYAGKGLQVIGIGIDTPANVAQFAQKFKIAYPLYVAGMGGAELSRQFGNAAGGLPYTVLIGADGTLKKTYLGRLNFERLRTDLDTL